MNRPAMLQSKPLVEGLSFAEGPRWHDGWLWFSDIARDRVMRVREDGSDLQTVAAIESPSGLGFLPDGTLLVVGMKSRQLHRVSRDGGVSLHADLSAYGAILNDMVVTAEGRAYVDCYRPGPAVPPPAGPDGSPCSLSGDIDRYYLNGLGFSHNLAGEILVVHPDGTSAVAASGLNYPNGLGITADGRTLIVSISHESRLTAFDIGENGTLANPRLWADLPGRHPDGLCLDADGGVWVACLAISAFLRVTEGGFITHHIPTYGRWSIAPALGGADRRTLFMISMEPIDVPGHRSWIEHVRVSSPGAGLP